MCGRGTVHNGVSHPLVFRREDGFSGLAAPAAGQRINRALSRLCSVQILSSLAKELPSQKLPCVFCSALPRTKGPLDFLHHHKLRGSEAPIFCLKLISVPFVQPGAQEGAKSLGLCSPRGLSRALATPHQGHDPVTHFL